jgi:hypothetical protein
MEGQDAICGVSITTECPSIEIKPIPALDFQLTFIDSLAIILKSSTQPIISVSLFDRIENQTNQVVIQPLEISNLHQVIQSRGFGIRLTFYCNEETIYKAYSTVLAMVKIVINAVDTLNKRFGLTYSARLGIINSGQATLTLAITKTV